MSLNGHAEVISRFLELRALFADEAAGRVPPPSGLGNKGITVKISEELGNRALDVGPPPANLSTDELANLRELERLRTPARQRRQAKYRARARAASTRGDRSRETWYTQRADALDRGYLPRALECEDPKNARGVELGCTSCGTVRWAPARCGVTSACMTCAQRKRGALFKRLAKGLGQAHRLAMRAWSQNGRRRGERPDVELVTLTCAHSGDIVQDRARLQKGWERLRARLYGLDGQALPFFRVVEMTDGTDELGHVHYHVAVVWPWRDLRALSAAWSDATDGVGMNVDVRGRKRAGRNPTKAASYVAGYVQKRGCSVRSLELRARWLDMLADGARLTSCSRGLLAPKEPTCSCPECKGPETVLRIERRMPRAYRCAPPTGPPAPLIDA